MMSITEFLGMVGGLVVFIGIGYLLGKVLMVGIIRFHDWDVDDWIKTIILICMSALAIAILINVMMALRTAHYPAEVIW